MSGTVARLGAEDRGEESLGLRAEDREDRKPNPDFLYLSLYEADMIFEDNKPNLRPSLPPLGFLGLSSFRISQHRFPIPGLEMDGSWS
ncbi:hypothetical protein MLD38_022762 [Melastoma candidum]|uniref:Uncharacterized protein n=1 Tax=Melastoma candidum TaxID=119954 RepID=A0ACB9QKE0_9MYRT|nr:hypothetical protein MLD38_022762 [Melastoma candidum]